MADKLPAFQFYPADWRKDPGIQALSFHDRGVWFEMLCLMHESSQRGYLTLNGKPMTRLVMARILGLTEDELEQTLQNLIDTGVASVDEDTGAIFNRRMVRDQEIREIRREAGSKGGNPNLKEENNKPGYVYAMKRSDGMVKIGAAVNPKNRLSQIKQRTHDKDIELLATMEVEDMGATELALHEQFNKYNHQGEWFNFPTDVEQQLIQQMSGNAKPNAANMPEQIPKQIPPPSSSVSSSKKNPTDSLKELPADIASPELSQAWSRWCDYRKAKRKTISAIAKEEQVENLRAWIARFGVSAVVASIRNSIASDYAAIFEPRPPPSGKPFRDITENITRIGGSDAPFPTDIVGDSSGG